MNWFELGIPGLLIICFLAATVLPLSSEIVVGIFLVSGYHPLTVFFVALAGNSLGGLTNIFLGRLGRQKSTKLAAKLFAREKVEKYGSWLALLSWIPIIGDPLLLILGFYRTRLLPTIALMITGKALRYVVLIWVVEQTVN